MEANFIVYFIYGLSFFSMGLVLLLETWRIDPEAPQKQLIQPLAVFGLLHGIHEWLEIFILQSNRTEALIPDAVVLLRLLLLAGSFLSLVLFSIFVIRYAHSHLPLIYIIVAAALPVFAILAIIDVVVGYSSGAVPVYKFIESLMRYMLGVPGAAISALGLVAAAKKARVDQRRPIDRYLSISAFGFTIYSLSQVFVPSMNTLLASQINTEVFLEYTRVPIQVVRTIAAVIITIGLFSATKFLEFERQKQLTLAREDHMRALEQKETLQRSLLRHVVQAQEEERSRISRELHDEFAQTLTAFTLNLGTLQQLTTNDKKSQRIIAHLQDLGKNMSHGMHQLVHDLRPSHLDDLGLVPALKHLADVDGPRLNLKVDFKIDGEVRRIDTLIETVIYRISQEAITNVARHAKTDQVCVCLSFQPDQIRLRIIDQGVGFNQNLTANSPHGWGLAGMKERVESVSGIFNIVSPNTGGTSIDVLIPILQKNTGS